ncbi:ABC transporter ATP-binding protein [uncultured Rubinisphaera sp.]|uniref:ABC transporter ATP-binding protein n=1 Tax=uncultured Rubinisphaera sp. TaxID=1678686 RepID=UPI0030D860F9|tara:strand:+ start:2310 stop:3077 length:768 start_codon:yes stop_codon:yes gene_type:complete
MTEEAGGPKLLLELRGIDVRFKNNIVETLQGIDLSISAGESIGIVGPSGCGKSTLLRVVAGLLSESAGQRILHEQEIANPGRIAMVFQDARLLPWRTVLSNMAIPFELVNQPVNREKIEWLLNKTGISPADYEKYPRQLSGGMKMRVAVARSLLLDPELLLLDEPFAAVDDFLREQLNDELIGWQQEFGFATVLVTHHLGEAVFLSQKILLMSAHPGQIVEEVAIPWSTRNETLRESSEYVALVAGIKHRLREKQ